jgi:4-amino-4-deoxy-L-arabinose transferase-like glycosyltransferase
VRWLVGVFVLAVCARIIGQIALGAYTDVDSFEYEQIATNLINGQGYTYASPDGGIYVASQSSPLYILLTAGVYAITDHSQMAMLLVQAVLGGVTAVLLAWLTGQIYSREVAFSAGLLVGIDPALIVYAAKLHSLTLDALANVALVSASVAVSQRPRPKHAAAAGALFGLAALTRATALLLLPLHLLWLARNRAVRLMSVPAALMVLLAVMVYAPWPIRNTLLLHQLTLGSSETSEWLWRGNNPNANGGSLTIDGRRMLDLAAADFRARIEAADESQRMTIYSDAAYAFITTRPLADAQLYLTKLATFWWSSDETGLLYPPMFLAGYRVWYIGIVLLASVGVWQSRSNGAQRQVLALVAGTLLMVSLTQAVFYVEGRHRLAIEPLLLPYAAAALVSLRHRRFVLNPRPQRVVGSDSKPLDWA